MGLGAGRAFVVRLALRSPVARRVRSPSFLASPLPTPILRSLPLVLVAAGLALPASAQIVDRSVGGRPGQIYATYSWGQVEKAYDGNAGMVNYGSRYATRTPDGTNATFTRAAFGGQYDVVRVGEYAAYLGAEASMAQAVLDVAARVPGLPAGAPGSAYEATSDGFKLQNVTLSAGFRGPAYWMRAGYLLDRGGKVAVNGTGDIDLSNTDGADAVVVGAGVRFPGEFGIGFDAGVDYYLTLGKKDIETTLPATLGGTATYDLDPADYIDAYAGVSTRFSLVELGAQLRYFGQRAGEVTNFSNPLSAAAIEAELASIPGRVPAEEDGFAVGVIPYVTLSPASFPVQLTVAGAAIREYLPYGFTLTGQHTPVGRTGVTATLKVGF